MGYTINTLAFSAGAMDSMLQMMMGTTDAALPIVMSPQMDAMFVGFGLCNAVIAALIYPQSFASKETVKFQQTVAAVFMFAFFAVMACMYNTGIMGVSGAAQYGVMNASLAASRSTTSRTCRWLPATRGESASGGSSVGAKLRHSDVTVERLAATARSTHTEAGRRRRRA